MNLAPIALFVYKRPRQTQLVLESLANNDYACDSTLYVFSDAAKEIADKVYVDEVRNVVRSQQWCKEVHLIERPHNLGLFKSITSGVSELVERFGRIIVIEDDLVLSKGFLDFINRALDKYESVERVMQISGHTFPFNSTDTNDANFIPVATCQGWATWKRAWKLFDPSTLGYESLIYDKALRYKFNVNGSFPYTRMLFAQKAGKISSWAICWWWSFFNNDGLCLYPSLSLVKNIGFGEGASHTKASDSYYNDIHWHCDRVVRNLPEHVDVDLNAFKKWQSYIRKHGSLYARVKRRLKSYFRFM